jgi:hypothetical protein
MEERKHEEEIDYNNQHISSMRYETAYEKTRKLHNVEDDDDLKSAKSSILIGDRDQFIVN